MESSTSMRVPNVDDLRVKLCYICREEELSSSPSTPPRAWTHPCHCTLVAHESCLLTWIQTSQATPGRAGHALQCPQCGAAYELVSDNTLLLRALGLGNRALQKLGRGVTAFGVAAVVGAVGSGIYFVCTGYGAWAVRQFIGKEMFDALLTDDPSNWPWTAFLNLPLIPLSLILSRFQSPSSPSPLASLLPTLLFFPPSFPRPPPSQNPINSLWTPTPPLEDRLSLLLPKTSTWPPSPLLFGLFVLPIVRAAYRAAYAHLYFRVLGAHPSTRSPLRGDGLEINEGRFVIRIRAIVDQNPPLPNAPAAPAPVNPDPAQPPEANAEDDPALAAAEQLIHADTASLGRRIAGALLVPAISSLMGSLLFRLARHSSLLRGFLDIRPRAGVKRLPYAWGVGGGAGPVIGREEWGRLGVWRKIGVTARLVASGWAGMGVWSEGDPVWWRNTVGLGLFFVAKDCIQLLHLYLAKRELQSRRVKNRNFAGVDIKELDLVPEFGAAS